MLQKIEELKKKLNNSKTMKGCVALYKDDIKEETLALHKESKLSLNKFAEMTGLSQSTLRSWRIYIGVPKVDTKFPNEHRLKEPEVYNLSKPKVYLTLSSKETRESTLAKKRIRNKARYKKIEIQTATQEKVVLTKKEDQKKPDELAEDIIVYLNRSMDAAIPIVTTRGDYVPKKFRDAQEEWLKHNKPKRYSPGGNLIQD